MKAHPSQIERAVSMLNDTGIAAVLVTGAALVNALEPIRGRLTAQAIAALDAFRKALGEE